MNITIKILGTEVENKGKYNMMTVSYKDIGQNKVAEKKLMSFVNKPVYEAIASSNSGDQFEITMQKNDKGYWDWISIAKPGEAPVASTSTGSTSKGNASPKSTYETSEERAARQVMIVRQSSLSTAAAVLKTDKKQPTTEELIGFAKELEAYVLGLDTVVGTSTPELPDLEDDIPY